MNAFLTIQVCILFTCRSQGWIVVSELYPLKIKGLHIVMYHIII